MLSQRGIQRWASSSTSFSLRGSKQARSGSRHSPGARGDAQGCTCSPKSLYFRAHCCARAQMPKDLPASDGDLGVPLHNLDKLMQCYGTLRSFGFILRLSPFSLMELCRDMAAQRVTPLVDEIHTTILALLQVMSWP